MRFVALLLTLVGLSAAALAGQTLWEEITNPPAAPAVAQVVAVSGSAEPQPPAAPYQWPALYGERQPPAPPEPQPPAPVVVAEPQPPSAPMPPLETLGYRLNGLVSAGSTVWALVSHPTGQRVLRPGDPLDDQLTVVRIGTEGIWVSNAQGTEALLAFSE